jgi:hypothetical protein
MPITPGGAGGGGGADFREAEIKRIREEKDSIKELIESQEKEQKAVGFMSDEYKEFTEKIKKNKDAIKDLNKELTPLLKQRVTEQQALGKLSNQYDVLTRKLVASTTAASKATNALKTGVAEYHSYNLSVQHAIDATGKFVGQSAQASREFDSFRRSLNLTRKAAVEFSDAWTTGLRLGVTNDQLKQMVGNLQKVHGQTQGLKLARDIIAIPVTRQTLQGVAGGDRGAMVQAMRMGNLQQMQAVASTAKIAGGRTPQTEAAIRFDRAVAKYETFTDDIRAGMQAFAAAGLGPETSAILAPVTDIAKNVATIAQNSSLMKQLMVRGGAQMLGGIPGVGGILSKIGLGGAGGAGGGGGLALSAGKLLKGLGFAALGEVGAQGANWGAGELEKRGNVTGAKWTRVGGMAARGAGLGAAVGSIIPGLGTGVGAGVGAAVGGAVGIAQQFGDTILKYAGWFGEKISKAGDWLGEKLFGKAGEEKVDVGDLLKSQGTLTKTVQENLAKLGPTLASLPESVRAGIATRAGEVGVGTVGREGVEEARGAFTKQIARSLDELVKTTNSERAEVIKTRDVNLKTARERGATPEDIKAINDLAQDALNSIEQTAQETLKGIDVGRGARIEMERMGTRRGQVGMEREAAAGRFKRTGAITGDLGEITRFQEEVNRTYTDEVKLLGEARDNVNKEWDIQDKILTDRIEANKDNKELVRQTELQLRDNQRKRADDVRILNNQEETLKLNKMEAEVANERAKVTAYELTATYRRAQAQRTLAQAQEEFARERGAGPAEIGGLARERAAGSAQMLSDFNKTFQQSVDNLTRQAEQARAGGNEAKAVQLEQEIYALRQKGVELARTEYQDRLHAATAAAERRMEELGVQKNILETVRDYAARTGQSWRVQMAYQSQIITVQRADLEAARSAFEAARAAGETGKPLMEKQLAVVQKQAALGEAIMGKQRDFLEKAVAQSFGMGGGTKALPNFSPRVFGEIVKDVTGGQWQGAPKTIDMTRQAMGGGIRGAIGMGGGINAAPGLPGVAPGAPGAPGAGPQAVAGGPGGAKGGIDVSGNFAVVVKADTQMFKAEVEAISAKVFDNRNKQGAIG